MHTCLGHTYTLKLGWMSRRMVVEISHKLIHILGKAKGFSFKDEMFPLKSYTLLSKLPQKMEMSLFQHFLYVVTPILMYMLLKSKEAVSTLTPAS